MDAQNATEAASTKPAASSASSSLPPRPSHSPDKPKPSSPASNSHTSVPLTKSPKSSPKSPNVSRVAPPSKDAKPTVKERPSHPVQGSAASTSVSSVPPSKDSSKGSGTSATFDASKDTKQAPVSSTRSKEDDSGGTDVSSEAETIVMSQDGSPSKPRSRKVIKHGDKANGDRAPSSTTGRTEPVPSSRKRAGERNDGQPERPDRAQENSLSAVSVAAAIQKKKRLERERHQQQNTKSASHPRTKDASSSLSSAPASPPRSRQRSASSPQSDSDSDSHRRSRSPRRTLLSKSHPTERFTSHKRKAPKAESEDEADSRKARRLRLASVGASSDGGAGPAVSSRAKSAARHSNTVRSSTTRLNRESSRNRSLSPQPRAHRRSHSTQLPSQSNGLATKKKRVPAPLQSADYNSDDSSASNGPFIRSGKLRSLPTPATADSVVSPAKIGPHKKHLDAHGQTFLARACARGEYELAKSRLQERPEDLNVADFAGNTPLQIAALNGYGDIVKLLLDAGCNLDCVNYDKDTPLLDAVDNGHLEVVRLLLDAGVNPRKANVHGEEPLDRVKDDNSYAKEIREALEAAKKNTGGRRFTSEEHRHENDDQRVQPGPESPGQSPAPTGAGSRRAATIRATKTSNHLLYMAMDDKTLRAAASRGDEETVLRILQVRESFDDAESMVSSARGGHDVVMQLLLALGKANPDPQPLSSAPPEYGTPILAAIGQENIQVIKLLLEQSSFNPTQRYKGDTYYEIARKRAGPNWKEEEDILKKAYDLYKKTHGGNTKSPSRKDSESRKSNRAAAEVEEPPLSRPPNRKLSSPSLERTKKAASSTKPSAVTSSNGNETSPREDKSSQKRAAEQSPKRTGSGSLSLNKHKQRDDPAVSDRETPPPAKQVSKSKRADSDPVAALSEGETVKPRRKLVSGRELKDGKAREKERSKQRRLSMASSSTGGLSKDSSSPNEPRHEDATSDKARAEKHRNHDRDRARQLKKEDSKEFGTTSPGDSSTKRHRLSETPPISGASEKDPSDVPAVKKRRLDTESSVTSGGGGKEKKASKPSTSPDAAPSKASGSGPRDVRTSSKAPQKRREDEDRKGSSTLKTKKREASSDGRRDSTKSSVSPSEKTIHVKSEDADVPMPDASPDARSLTGSDADTTKAQRDKDDGKKKSHAQPTEAKRKEDDHQRRRQDEDKKRKEEEKAKRELEETKKRREVEERKKEEESRLKEKKRLEETERKHKEDERRRKADERRQKEQKEEEERKRREEEEAQKKREEDERKKLEDERKRREEERKRHEEEERKRREEEERLRQEQLEQEAAEAARRQREEVERKERERKEQDRIRAEKEAEDQRRQQQLEEEERIRLAALPPVLRWLSLCPNPQLASVAKAFRTMQGVRYDCIDTSATGSPEGREQWVMNTQVALVLGEKDISLSRFPSWRRLPVNMIAKRIIWRLESDRYSLTDPRLFDFGKQLPGYYGADGPEAMSYLVPDRLRREAWETFSSTDMFFVKVSDVMDAVPSVPHLRDVRLTVVYRELPEEESQLATFATTQKWKSDPNADRFHGFAPRNKYYVNGKMVKEELPGWSATSKTPFPDVRVPRRGFVSVPVHDPCFNRLCLEQGIDPSPFLSAARMMTQEAKLPNGVPHVPETTTSKTNASGLLAHAILLNGDDSSDGSRSMSPLSGPPNGRLPNGVNNVNGIHGVNGVNGVHGLNGIRNGG